MNIERNNYFPTNKIGLSILDSLQILFSYSMWHIIEIILKQFRAHLKLKCILNRGQQVWYNLKKIALADYPVITESRVMDRGKYSTSFHQFMPNIWESWEWTLTKNYSFFWKFSAEFNLLAHLSNKFQ